MSDWSRETWILAVLGVVSVGTILYSVAYLVRAVAARRGMPGCRWCDAPGPSICGPCRLLWWGVRIAFGMLLVALGLGVWWR
jgi:hypothetical protein